MFAHRGFFPHLNHLKIVSKKKKNQYNPFQGAVLYADTSD